MPKQLEILILLFVAMLLVLGCAGTPTTMNMKDPETIPAQDKEIVFPNGLITGDESRQQASALAEIMVQSHNMAVKQRERMEQTLEQGQQVTQRLREAYERNQQSAVMALEMLRELGKQQGTGEITIFFPVDSAKIPEDSSEYERLVRFADYLAREANGRTLHIISVGSASAFGPKKRNRQLAEDRAQAPVPILDHYLVKIPHEYYKIYGTGDTYSPRGVDMKVHQRYQHVHLVAFYDSSEAPQSSYGTTAALDSRPSLAADSNLPFQQPSDVAQADSGLGAVQDKGFDATSKQQFSSAQIGSQLPQGKTFTNSVGMDFVRLQPGTFTMGSPAGEYGRDDNERQHQVVLTNPFYIQTTEVTQMQWKEVMGNNPSYFQICGPNCPIEQVSWHDVQDFIKALNQMEQTATYRFPTEAEWEYACRAGSQSPFHGGGQITEDTLGYNQDLGARGWYFRNSEKGTHSVGQKMPNAWGLYDMHGNVWEWCLDWVSKYPFRAVTDPAGPEQGFHKIRRGGSWSHYPMFCRSAYRSWFDPNNATPEIGFRLVKDVKEPPYQPQTVQADQQPAQAQTSTADIQTAEVDRECVLIPDVTFAFDSAAIREVMIPVLRKAAAWVKQRDSDIEVEGHTCSLGSDSYNQNLSERRAESVRGFLVEQGVSPRRITATGYGETRPKYDNATQKGRRLNRRVEIHSLSR